MNRREKAAFDKTGEKKKKKKKQAKENEVKRDSDTDTRRIQASRRVICESQPTNATDNSTLVAIRKSRGARATYINRYICIFRL